MGAVRSTGGCSQEVPESHSPCCRAVRAGGRGNRRVCAGRWQHPRAVNLASASGVSGRHVTVHACLASGRLTRVSWLPPRGVRLKSARLQWVAQSGLAGVSSQDLTIYACLASGRLTRVRRPPPRGVRLSGLRSSGLRCPHPALSPSPVHTASSSPSPSSPPSPIPTTTPPGPVRTPTSTTSGSTA